MPKPAWRQIIKRERYTTQYHERRIGAYSVFYTLECGHQQCRKGSKEPKGLVVRCRECEYAAADAAGGEDA